MKRRYLVCWLLAFPVLAAAQRKSQTDTGQMPIDTVHTRTIDSRGFETGSRVVAITDLDQRKIYRWENGQRSTASGRQAADEWARYVRVFGDSAVVVPGPGWGKDPID